MPRLSLVMIVRNEAQRLGTCLASTRGIADEICVADTGSTDDTPRIARNAGAHVFPIPWEDDFAAARNSAMTQATGDWLLQLDADETLDPEGAQRIRAIVDADGEGVDAVEVVQANYCATAQSWRWHPAMVDDPHAGGMPGFVAAPVIRLFRNRRGYLYSEPVHETITESVRQRGGIVRAEPIVVHHHGYARRFDAPGPKDELYLRICRRKALERPGDPKAWHDLGQQALALGLHGESEQACRRALALAPDYLDAAMALANHLLLRDALDEAEPLLRRICAGPEAPGHAWAALGAAACRRGNPRQARDMLAAAADLHRLNVVLQLQLARACDLLEESAHAQAALDAAVAAAPALEEAQHRRQAWLLRRDGERLCREGNWRSALERFVGSLRLDAEDPLTHNSAGVALAGLGIHDRAAASFRRALLLAPHLDAARENLAALTR